MEESSLLSGWTFVLAIVAGVVALVVLARGKLNEVVTDFITDYRAIFIIIFLIPMNIVYDLVMKLRTDYLLYKFSRNKHEDRVKFIQEQVLKWKKSGSKKPMVTARPGWHTMSQKGADWKEDCSKIKIDMYSIYEVNPEKRTVKCEPLVTMGQVTHKLIPKGWTLAITPELDDLTVGGLLMGFGVETTSHKYGLFQDICESFEVVMADGSVVTASATQNVDLFRALPWSHGTLGFLVSAELKIVPAKPYIELTYNPFSNKAEALKFFESVTCSKNPPEFVEGLAYSDQEYVVMTGEFADKPNSSKGAVNAIGTWYKPWFFTHAATFLKKGKTVEYIPLRDYYHRHTKSLFWEMEHIIPFGNNIIFRVLFGWWNPRVSLMKLTETESLHKKFTTLFVFQDMLVPMSKLSDTLSFFDKNYQIYPVWLCAHKVFNTKPLQGFLKPSKEVSDWEMFVDVGAYGPPKKAYNNLVDMPKMERYVIDQKGFQALYAITYMSREEFRTMFNHELYDQMRKKYNALGAFPEVYDKVSGKRKH